MTAPIVENRGPLPQQPIPERFEYEAPWTTKSPDGADVEVQLWSDHNRGDAVIRTRQGLILGAVAAGKAAVKPDKAAVERYGTEWVETQLLSGQKLLTYRMGRA